MSKAGMNIVLENSKRIFQGGETIRGKVQVAVHATMQCKALRLTGLWRTHGRGNRAMGEYYNVVLAEGQWQAGDRMEFPFEFQIPHRPVTYRGRLLNVDHYVRVRADVPWAFDPKTELDFVVLPSQSAPPIHLPPLSAASGVNTTSAAVKWGMAAVLIMFGVLFLPFFGLGLIPMAIGAVMIFYAVRNSIAEKRLGSIQVSIPTRIAGPGQSIPLSIAFVPNRSGKINGIRATLTGQERVVSGSGTNRRTHTHPLHKSICECTGPKEFSRGNRAEYHARLQIPNTRAYSFQASDNSVIWSLALHVDLPMWPDWTRNENITVVPAEHLQAPPVRGSEPRREATDAEIIDAVAHEPDIVLATPVLVEEESDPMVNQEELEQPPELLEESNVEIPEIPIVETAPDADTPPNLIEISEMLSTADRFSDQSDQILEAVEGDVHDVDLEIDRVTSTFGYMDETEFRNGKTVSGTLADSEQRISVQLPESWNDRARELRTGDHWQGRARIVGWDHFYDRLEMKLVD